MKYLYAPPDTAEAALLQGFLEGHGIGVLVKNGLPRVKNYDPVEIWVLNDADYKRAQELTKDWISQTTLQSNKERRTSVLKPYILFAIMIVTIACIQLFL